MSFEDIFYDWVSESRPDSKVVLLSDRGIMDGKAYVSDVIWHTLLDEFETHEIHWRDIRYDAVIHLVTAADGAVDFYSGVIYNAIGTPANMFTAMFAIGRLPGWIAQWMEMHTDPDFKIGRPRQIYTGETRRTYTPLDQR